MSRSQDLIGRDYSKNELKVLRPHIQMPFSALYFFSKCPQKKRSEELISEVFKKCNASFKYRCETMLQVNFHEHEGRGLF